MGCCCKNKNEEKQYNNRKIRGIIKDDYNIKNENNDKDKKKDFNNDKENDFENANGIEDKEENSFDNGNNIEYRNYILAEINIEECNVNKNIRIINICEESKKISKGFFIIDDHKHNNEKEIKENCIIKIDDKYIKPFNYFYKFKEKGNFKLRYIFKNNIENVAFMFYKCESLSKIDLSHFNTQNITKMIYMFSGM